ncbi:MAG: sensor histidine kinase [Brumimicrobium sp.]|nr:sensor histidine kinase [Brumimicrobium sp.]
MIRFLKVPRTELIDFYDKARFALTWRIAILFAVATTLLTVATYIGDDRFFEYYLAVVSLLVISILYMYKTHTYRAVCVFITFGISVIIIISVLTVNDALHIMEALWMTIVILLSFFTLGRKWATFYLVLNAVLYGVYFNFFFTYSLESRVVMTRLHTALITLEFAFAMFLIGYIMYQFGLVNNYAEKLKKETFKALESEKRVVEMQNKEKTALLQEIHHRVKNNLQVIISLLRIQANELKSPESQQSFNDAISRIMTMSLIHQKMYEKESLANIQIEDYLNQLIGDILETSVTRGNVEFKVSSDITNVGSKAIVPLALIINELVSNSIKHAFEGDGKISLKIQAAGEEHLEMFYSDNGTWKEQKLETSLGLQLIEAFTEQMEGSFKTEIDEAGTHYYFSLKNVDQ